MTCKCGAPMEAEQKEKMIDEIKTILEQYLSVTDEWGGAKLAEWRYGYNVVVDGIDAAAQAIQKLIDEHPVDRVRAMAALIEDRCGQPWVFTDEWRVPDSCECSWLVRRYDDGTFGCESDRCGLNCIHVQAVHIYLAQQERSQEHTE